MKLLKRIRVFWMTFVDYRSIHEASLIQSVVWAFEEARDYQFYTLADGRVTLETNRHMTDEDMAKFQKAVNEFVAWRDSLE